MHNNRQLDLDINDVGDLTTYSDEQLKEYGDWLNSERGSINYEWERRSVIGDEMGLYD